MKLIRIPIAYKRILKCFDQKISVLKKHDTSQPYFKHHESRRDNRGNRRILQTTTTKCKEHDSRHQFQYLDMSTHLPKYRESFVLRTHIFTL